MIINKKVKLTMKTLTLKSTNGEFIFPPKNIKDYLVLYFYPKDATPGCTVEGHDFSKLLPKFRRLGVNVLGVSRDSIKSHEKFKEKEKYSVDLIADEEAILCNLLEVIKLKKNYGKEYLGIERSTFIINPQGKIIKQWRKVKVEGHAQEVLTALEEIINTNPTPPVIAGD